jgi:hypothetical protein
MIDIKAPINFPIISSLHDSSWQDDVDFVYSTGGYSIFTQGEIVDTASFLPQLLFSQASAEAGYMVAAHSMLTGSFNNQKLYL